MSSSFHSAQGPCDSLTLLGAVPAHYSTVWIRYSLLIHSPVDEELSCFQGWAIMNEAAHYSWICVRWAKLVISVGYYYGPSVSLPNSYVEARTPNVMVWRSGVFGGWLGLDSHEGRAPAMGFVTIPIAPGRKRPDLLFAMWGCSRKADARQPANVGTLGLGFPTSRTWERNACGLSHPSMVFCYNSQS